ncbi:PREDICTED: transmembrane protein 11, mitochondrial-like [Amphimedon queenslandica]|uniref:Transmembrane protein 11, mitochondrial n=1 Tax=Amphimedon queenslandica TaxID=400682 RepID=A0A1X7UKN3_AMPQE|nr:PREDICTED: transmembrane protein 11, mitochondrial-like [Amphimedon queenslandica]|eukprot:XP_011404821.1 PREDICTED: transmembrane protein 11, mitochondrial-like [Amphimedon queenslandica]
MSTDTRSGKTVPERKSWYILHKGGGLPTDKPREKKDKFERELEVALERHYDLIVIEPRYLGDEVIRWIKTGNFLHKSSVLSCLSSFLFIPLLPKAYNMYFIVPVGLYGVGSALVYNLSWQFDPCCKYQVDWYGQELMNVPSGELTTTTPVVLVKRNDIYRKVLHSLLAATVGAYIAWRLYKDFKIIY